MPASEGAQMHFPKRRRRRAIVMASIILMCGTAVPAAASGDAAGEADEIASLVRLAAPMEELGSVSLFADGAR